MRKVDIVRRIAEETACTKAQADAAVEAILATVKEGLQQGDSVILRRFGTFRVRAKRARVGRNPRSGAAAAIAARRVVRFTRQPDVEAGGGWGGDRRGISAGAAREPAQARSGAMSSSVRPAVSGNHLATRSAPGNARVARAPIATQWDARRHRGGPPGAGPDCPPG